MATIRQPVDAANRTIAAIRDIAAARPDSLLGVRAYASSEGAPAFNRALSGARAAALGIAAMVLFMRIDYRWLRVVSIIGFLVALVLLAGDGAFSVCASRDGAGARLVPALPEIGFAGLSTYGPRQRPEPVRGLRQINTHVDLIDWKGGGGFVGENIALALLIDALAAARTRDATVVGVLSHHLVMDEGTWDFLRSLWEKISVKPGLRMSAAQELFASREARV